MPEDEDDQPREMKVTDRRMFTADGELREEFRDVGSGRQTPEPEPPPPRQPEAPEAAAPASPTEPAGGETAPSGELPGGPGEAPAFLDLVAVLAEPVPIYLGDTPLPDGRSAENLDAARFHIDLLDILRQKTAGNLSTQETGVLEDILYRLRMRFVQKRG